MEKDSWKIKSLGEVVEFLDGKRIPLKDSERANMKGDIPYYGANGQIDSINKFIFDEPLVLLAEDGGHFGSKTKPIAYKVEGKSWVNNHAHVLKPINGLNIDFLKWSLAFYDVAKFTTGSTRVKLTKGDALKMQIPVPDLKTQQKIASILEQADAARQKRKQANQLTEQFLQSAFLEMFGDPVRNEKGWEVKRFGEISESRLGKMLDGKKQKGFQKYPYLGNSNVKWGTFEFDNLLEMEFSDTERKELELKEGDLLICEGGEIGRCAIWRNEISNTYFQKAIHRVRLIKDKAVAEYIQYLLWYFAKNNGFKDYVSTSTISHLTGVKLKSMLIPLPPLRLQQKFASIVEQVEQLRNKQRESEKELENLFGSLMQRYFG